MRRASFALVVLVCVLGSLVARPSSGPAAERGEAATRVTYGQSFAGRELRAVRLGDSAAKRSVLVVGSIHGDERQGERIVHRLRNGPDRFRADVWTIQASNPDGARANRRTNARGVDLNRNFPYRWRRAESPGSGYYQGPKPASEPETRALMRLVRRIEPALTIWYHQPWGQVLAPCGGSARKEHRYARIARMPVERCRGEALRGTATSWQEHRDRRATAFVVELGSGRLGSAELARHARAARALAGWGRRGGAGPASPEG
ncbi:DUF2817 domain-containing protein [Thermoleophilia bacterium SCSIO 60948]|nr:DUF2817 domain-containing protein [Thermoleophilia bacterium SCSIO 60948]